MNTGDAAANTADADVLPFAVSRRGAKVAAAVDPVARVAVDVSLAHLDRPFDYLVPEKLSSRALPGCRVRVRFAGQLVDGFVLERLPSSAHGGRLAFIERAVSAESVLSPEIARLARAVADHWAGTFADVLRLAVPARHAHAEAALTADSTQADAARRAGSTQSADPTRAHATDVGASAAPADSAVGWHRYPSGAQLLAALRDGRSPRAVWPALPGAAWPAEISELVAATLYSGRGAVVVVPDRRDVARVDAALAVRLGAGRHVVLTADVGPAQRYRRFLALRRGLVSAVVGTRAAAFAPVANLGLVVVWDDGDDLHAEPRAPYPHAREVLVLRAHLAGSAAVLGGHLVTAEGARLVATGWAKWVAPIRSVLRARAPMVSIGDDPTGREVAARLPTSAWDAAHSALRADLPVLIQVPRRGYLRSLACDRCHTRLRCAVCAGPLAVGAADAAPVCRWCGRLAPAWTCPECGSRRFRASVVGARRTAEELGRAFPGHPVRTSSHDQVLDDVPAGAALVIATPGAEPVAAGGYGAALLLDGWALLSRSDLRAGEEALRRWLNAAALVRPAADGGRVVVLADSALPAVQALVRFDAAGYAERELADRVALGFPPAITLAEVSGADDAVAEFAAGLVLPASAQLLGPVPTPGADDHAVAADGRPPRKGSEVARVRLLVRVPRDDAMSLAVALRDGQAIRSAHKNSPVRVRIDPVDIG